MSLEAYRRIEKEAYAAAVDAEPAEAARLRLEAWDRIPRFPSLLPLHGELLSPIVEESGRPAHPAVVADALRRLIGVARATGSDGLVLRAAEEVEALVEAHGEADPFVAWVASFAAAARALRDRGPEEALDPWGEAEARARALGRPDLAVDQGFLRFDVARRADDPLAALQALEPVAEALEGRDESWDGERHEVHLARGLMLVQRDAPGEALDAALAAHALSVGHGLPRDVGQDVTSAVPLLLHLGRHDEARRLLEDALARVVAAEEDGALEMALRHLDMKTRETAGDVSGAITAGFEAVKRSGVRGTLDHYVNFMAHIATLYLQVDAYLDCYHIIDVAERTLSKRKDGAAHARVFEDLKRALESDLGEARYERIVAEHDQIEPSR